MEELISVIINVYNGEKYILEQLQSIFDQTLKVDEVIIKDDLSTDNTVNIIKKFIKDNKLKDWKVFTNKKNIGWMKNFKETIELCNNPLVFLCDQDDIWYKSKTYDMINIMKKNKDVDLLVSSYNLLKNNKIINSKCCDGKLVKIDFNVRNLHNHYPGCTYLFRKKTFDDNIEIWNDKLPHDLQLSNFTKPFGKMYCLNKPLIKYRRHDNNASDTKKGLKQKIDNNNRELIYINQLSKIDGNNKLIKRFNKYAKYRYYFLVERKFTFLLRLLRYIRFYYNPRDYITDIYYFIFDKRENKNG